jgi:hypothetical protein
MLTVRVMARGPNVTWTPRAPKVRLDPDFEKLTDRPGRTRDAAVKAEATHQLAGLALLPLLVGAPFTS